MTVKFEKFHNYDIKIDIYQLWKTFLLLLLLFLLLILQFHNYEMVKYDKKWNWW